MNILQTLVLITLLAVYGVNCAYMAPARPSCDDSFSFILPRSKGYGYKIVNSARWMNDLNAQIAQKKYSSIAIPATHDSGTYLIDDTRAFSADTQTDPSMQILLQLDAIFGAYGVNRTLVKAFIAPWMHNQQCSVGAQLMHGIRHFDFRVCVVPGVVGFDKFVACHGLVSDTYNNILTDITEFSRLHPHELISVDFNHLYGFTSSALHNEFLNGTLNRLGGSLGPGTFNRTVGHILVESTERVTVFYANTAFAAAWNVSASADLPTPWANKQDFNQLVDALVLQLNGRTDFDRGFVVQFVMTPDLNMLVSGIITGQNSARVIADTYYTDLEDIILDEFYHKKINIINTDYYTRNFVKAIVSINA